MNLFTVDIQSEGTRHCSVTDVLGAQHVVLDTFRLHPRDERSVRTRDVATGGFVHDVGTPLRVQLRGEEVYAYLFRSDGEFCLVELLDGTIHRVHVTDVRPRMCADDLTVDHVDDLLHDYDYKCIEVFGHIYVVPGDSPEPEVHPPPTSDQRPFDSRKGDREMKRLREHASPEAECSLLGKGVFAHPAHDRRHPLPKKTPDFFRTPHKRKADFTQRPLDSFREVLQKRERALWQRPPELSLTAMCEHSAEEVDALQERSLPWSHETGPSKLYGNPAKNISFALMPKALTSALGPRMADLEKPGETCLGGQPAFKHVSVQSGGTSLEVHPGFQVQLFVHGKLRRIGHVMESRMGGLLASAALLDPRLQSVKSACKWMQWMVFEGEAAAWLWLAQVGRQLNTPLTRGYRGGGGASSSEESGL